MTFVEDPSFFFADFGETATIGSSSIQVIFDREYLAELNMMQGSNPIALCRDVDIAGISQDSVIVIRGTNFTIREFQPDGTGLTVLQLWAP